jgi:chromosome segregation ATPase
MEKLKQELKEILEERKAITILQEQWQLKWEKLAAQSDQINIDLVVLQKELEAIRVRVRTWQQRQMKYEADVKEIIAEVNTMIRETIPSEIH